MLTGSKPSASNSISDALSNGAARVLLADGGVGARATPWDCKEMCSFREHLGGKPPGVAGRAHAFSA